MYIFAVFPKKLHACYSRVDVVIIHLLYLILMYIKNKKSVNKCKKECLDLFLM